MSDVIKSLDLTDGRVVLFDGAADAYRAENLACFDPDGSLRWRAALPHHTGPDRFVDVVLGGGCMRASTWSGWAIWLDSVSGATIKSEFSK
ncbi:hypothetical protein [Bradyrhizobium viridifuturi]|uniref:hypothetical protein n=1 Tax=Bradyrhizobium viridifuturi TaxID=1654716 RepID=UPI00067EA396|nr:hypothetical protein [Bradyrhizobium viridifuturi]